MQDSLPALVISAQAPQRSWVADIIVQCGLRPVFCPTLDDARAMVQSDAYSVIFCSDQLPGGDLGRSLRTLTAAAPGAPIIVLSNLAEWDGYVKAIGAGAFDYVVYSPNSSEAE